MGEKIGEFQVGQIPVLQYGTECLRFKNDQKQNVNGFPFLY